MPKTQIDTPIGSLDITASETGITSICFSENTIGPNDSSPILSQAAAQLSEYFSGNRITFDLPLEPHGTDFQKRVWNELQTIAFGTTASYLDIAKLLGDVNATRAIGAANGKNPIAIVVPCHRIIGTNGKLTGYAGGLHRKEWLLHHESSEELF